MAPHSSTLARKIPWTEEPGGLQSVGSHRVGSDLAAAAVKLIHSLYYVFPFTSEIFFFPIDIDFLLKTL